jgi:hypothetical protein
MTNVVTFADAVISVSAAEPATYDQAGFEALTFTQIGEVISVGGRGRTYTDVSYKTLAERGTLHRKGSYDEPETTFEIGADRTDAGQIIMKAGSKSDDNHSFKIEYSNGEVDYFYGLIFSYVTNGGDADTMRMISANIRIDRTGVLEVDAP